MAELSVGAAAPLEIPFNTTATLGPDGPWNFITLNLGSGSASNVSFYPQTEGDISILTSPTLCQQDSSRCVDGAEYFDGQAASTQTAPEGIQVDWQSLDSSAKLGQSNFTSIGGNVTFWEEGFNDPLDINNLTVLIAQNTIDQIGASAFAPVSLLQLSASSHKNADADLNKTKDGKSQAVTLTWPVQQSSQSGRPKSYNLHMGSAAFGQPGSLFFGGYDSKRVIEPMYRFLDDGLALLDISLETAFGPSPWGSNNGSGDFADTIYEGTIATAYLAPESPYFTLTPSLCQAMSAKLPIQYDSLSKLYLWNQADPMYHQIMSTPSFMRFNFSGGDSRFDIRVPFATLNLTLGVPIKNAPVPYFPCASSNNKYLTFGRAFLQSANLGYFNNGNVSYKYLGQAPGPMIGKNTTASPMTLDSNGYSVDNSITWEETWAGTWAELSSSSSSSSGGSGGRNNSTGSTPNAGSGVTSHNLSSGQIIGIVVGAFVAVAILGAVLATALAAAGLWRGFGFMRRRRGPDGRAKRGFGKLQGGDRSNTESSQGGIMTSQDMDSQTRLELSAMNEHEVEGVIMCELSATSGPLELPDGMSVSSRRTSMASYMYH